MRTIVGSVGWTTFLVSLCMVSAPSLAQIPESFENLQMLDSGIERAALVSTMQEWTRALGVRFTHCHDGPDDLVGMDFASDEKPTKRTARRMLAMVRLLNAEHLTELPTTQGTERTDPPRISCHTCHHGMARPPRATSIELVDALEARGAEGAIHRFQELRADHADAGRYDLRPTPLFRLGRTLLQEGRIADGHELISAMLELYPSHADGHVLLGQAELMAGDLEAARAAIAEARRIEPQNRFSNWLEQQVDAAETVRERPSQEDEGDGG